MQILANLFLRYNSFIGPSLSKHVRYFQTSSTRTGLSDPFKPSQKKSLEDSKKFYEEKLKNIKQSDGYKFSEKSENFFTRMVRKSLNPTPINTDVRAKFGINADYKLCYLINHERVHLIVFGLMNSVFPTFFALVGLLSVTELTGQSQFSQSFENPYLYITTISAYFMFAFVMSRLSQGRTVFRIYYNEKENQFILIKLKRFLSFEAEKFTIKDVKYRFPSKDQTNVFVNNIKNAHGNVSINNVIRRIEFNQFSMPYVIEKMVGPRAAMLIKQELSAQGQPKLK